MHPDERKMLEESVRLAHENNRLLRKIRRSAVLANIMSFVYYALIIGVPIVLYYFFLQPYVGQFLDIYRTVGSGADQFQGFSAEFQSNPGIQKFLENFGITQ